MDDANFFPLLQCITILDRVSNVYTAYAVTEWPKRMQDDGDLRGLFSFAFNKLAGIRFYVSNALRQTFSETYSEIGNLLTLRETYATEMAE